MREAKTEKDTNTVWTISYEYDAAGNRTKKTEDGNETNYSYDDFNKMTAAGSTSFGYDNNGNMTSKTENSQTTSYAYDYAGRMTSITYPDQSTNSFGYYASGHRAWKVDSAGTSRFVYDGDEYGAPILAEVGGGGDYIATYTHGVNGLVSQRRGSTTNWYHYDDLGSTRDLTNSSQTITDTYTYKAFGEIPASTGSTTNPFRYIGSLNYYKDSDSTFLLLGARYYGAQWGRFTTADPRREGRNWFRYASGSPTARTDARGCQVGPEDVFNVITAYECGQMLDWVHKWRNVACNICCHWFVYGGGWSGKPYKFYILSLPEYLAYIDVEPEVGYYLGAPPVPKQPQAQGLGQKVMLYAQCRYDPKKGGETPEVFDPNLNEWFLCPGPCPGYTPW